MRISGFSESTILLNLVLLFPSLGLLSFEISAKTLILRNHGFSKSGFCAYERNPCFANFVFSKTTIFPNLGLLFPSLGLLSFEISAKTLILRNHGFSKPGFAVFWVLCFRGNPVLQISCFTRTRFFKVWACCFWVSCLW